MPNGMSEKPTSLVGCGVGGGTREGTLYPIFRFTQYAVSKKYYFLVEVKVFVHESG